MVRLQHNEKKKSNTTQKRYCADTKAVHAKGEEAEECINCFHHPLS